MTHSLLHSLLRILLVCGWRSAPLLGWSGVFATRLRRAPHQTGAVGHPAGKAVRGPPQYAVRHALQAAKRAARQRSAPHRTSVMLQRPIISRASAERRHAATRQSSVSTASAQRRGGRDAAIIARRVQGGKSEASAVRATRSGGQAVQQGRAAFKVASCSSGVAARPGSYETRSNERRAATEAAPSPAGAARHSRKTSAGKRQMRRQPDASDAASAGCVSCGRQLDASTAGAGQHRGGKGQVGRERRMRAIVWDGTAEPGAREENGSGTAAGECGGMQ